MLSEKQCRKLTETIPMPEADSFWESVFNAPTQMAAYKQNGDLSVKENVLKVLNELTERASAKEPMLRAAAIWMYAELSVSVENGREYNEKAQLLADDFLCGDVEPAPDTAAALAAGLMALANKYTAAFLRHAYINHARIYADKADIKQLSPAGCRFLHIALDKLLDTRRRYLW